eukprot:4262683-Pyramimonas_sp.AAC.1
MKWTPADVLLGQHRKVLSGGDAQLCRLPGLYKLYARNVTPPLTVTSQGRERGVDDKGMRPVLERVRISGS